MSTKHYFPSAAANTLVPRALKSLVQSNPHLDLDETDRVVANAHHDHANVSIIGGGGSGHEPAWSGYVGDGLLSAAACGDIFASPSTKQVVKAIRMAPSSNGVILLITNYTGDRLHFGLAAEKAKAEGLADNIVVLPATDDVSIGKSTNSRLGRRGLAGHVLMMKILGGAAAKGSSFEDCLEIGKAVNDNTVTIGSALDHCHVPGRQHQSLADDICVVGAGIHNEPGQQIISPFPSVENLVDRCLQLLCNASDSERAFTTFAPGDQVVLLVNNYGGLSPLELGALADEILGQLESRWNVSPCRVFTGTFETSLNAPGFSISLCNLTAAAKQSKTDSKTLHELLDSPTTAVSWPNTTRPSSDAIKRHSTNINSHGVEKAGDKTRIQVDGELLEKIIRRACERVIAAEPKLTEWDMVMGDGDCGEAVKGLAELVLSGLDAGSCRDGSVLGFLRHLIRSVDDTGGTLGAIFSILLSAFQTALCTNRAPQNTPEFYATALASAVASLKKHTSAREGDRTVMDALLPFADEFVRSEDFGKAVAVAADKAEGTRYVKARFGRATYVGQEASQELPDPGAWALYEIVAGLAEGMGKQVA
ncbi:hypothetical protein LCI18_002621 [Fusarium solani-melongenae]|uniref:Uncharacterized protein n=2 Tax=Fusarium solani subsp. cucurbitae TaxID=2747967 RepID=A0ACD3YRC9_FUSSC|nr:hypothetical protein LCI18_002425 [Fusarium solani-melongenae]UPK91686.1 hypothetical protein LCI18_002621 [Fusarium solani-melongenae]